MVEWPVAAIDLDGDQRLDDVARRREQREIPLGVEAAASDRERVLLHDVARHELDDGGGGEIAVLGKVRALQDIDELDGLREEEVQVRIALAVGVAAEVHR